MDKRPLWLDRRMEDKKVALSGAIPESIPSVILNRVPSGKQAIRTVTLMNQL
jgi:hypothetical protein